MHAEPEVNYLNVVPIIDYNVLQLQITMTYFLAMKISDTLTYLFEKVPCSLLWDHTFLTFIFDILIQADTTHILLDQIDILGCFERVDKLHYVRVFEFLHAVDLAKHCFTLGRIIELEFGVNLHCDFAFGVFGLG